MDPADLFRITQEVEAYMQERDSIPLVYNVINALDKLGYLKDPSPSEAYQRERSE